MILFSWYVCGNEDSVCLFSLDYLYPQRYFYQVESTSKELWSDLDLLVSDTSSRAHIMEKKSSYLYDQFRKVHKSVRNFVDHEKKANTYLADDVKYLVAIFDCIQEKVFQLAPLVESKEQVMMLAMYNLLLESKGFLDELLQQNQEVALHND